ncbi:MAG TPA: M56 family metallopeptidase [Blastocatellia bacterium]|nr:M56 family metallopeptidase [Blastocatellia bacterium]
MSEPFLLRSLVAISIWTLEATGVLLVAWLIAFLDRKNAARRHLTWLTAFVVLLLIPPVTALMPAHFYVAVPLRETIRDLSAIQEPLPSSARSAHERTLATKAQRSSARPATLSTTTPPERARDFDVMQFRQRVARGLLALAGLWLAGAAGIGLQGISGLYGIRQMRRRSLSYVRPDVDLPGIAAKAGLKRRWELRISATPSPPAAMTWGHLRPIVLLPYSATSWPAERLEAVLLHELAHVRRYDGLSQLLALCVCALYWFHPAVWLCARAMRAAAEGAADDAVLFAGVKPSVYAAELLRFAAHLGSQNLSSARIGVPIMKQSKVEVRIKSIVDPSHRRRRVTLVEVLRTAGLGLLMLLTLSTLHLSASPVRDRHNANGPRMAGGMPHMLPRIVLGLRSGTGPVNEQHLAKASAIPAGSESATPADRQEPGDDLVTLRGLTDKREYAARHKENAVTIHWAVNGLESATRAMAEADAATAFQRQRNAKRASQEDVMPQATVQAGEAFLSRQRALEDMRRGAGNANGAGMAREAKALKRTAETIGPAHDPASASRALSEVDAEGALHQQ